GDCVRGEGGAARRSRSSVQRERFASQRCRPEPLRPRNTSLYVAESPELLHRALVEDGRRRHRDALAGQLGSRGPGRRAVLRDQRLSLRQQLRRGDVPVLGRVLPEVVDLRLTAGYLGEYPLEAAGAGSEEV